ncbi:MAG: class I mannose-6-phosphate isomerase [Actinomycetota bacterium]
MEPIVLGANQIHRFYRGGEAIAGFRGMPHRDKFAPEDWVGSATAVFGSETMGVSTLPDGRTVREALVSDPEAFLGSEHTERFGAEMGLLVKLLDAGQRLPVHCHPGREFARRHLDCPYGKTEAWIVVDVRSPDPFVHLGFRDDVDLATLTEWVTGQDTAAIVEAMHRLPAAVGDSILVPAGVPHAIGEGVFIVELQEPTDLSVLLEWEGFDIDGARDGHLGLGFETALGCVDRSGWGQEELGRLRAMRENGRARPGVDLLFPREADPFFRAERIRPRGTAPLPAGLSILVVTAGSGTLQWGERRLEVGRGDTVLIPFAAGDCVLNGPLEAVRCMPPDPAAPDASAPTFR